MAQEFPSHAQLSNLALMEELYSRYAADPGSVDPSWRHFFEGIDFARFLTRGQQTAGGEGDARVFQLIEGYRRYGHLKVPINPIALAGRSAPELDLQQFGFQESDLDASFPSFGFCASEQAPLKEIIAALESIYCSRMGFEYMDIDSPPLQKWIQQKIEPQLKIEPTLEEKHYLLKMLNRSEIFETFIHTKFVGQKRFSLEGLETMIPVISEIIDTGAELGLEEVVIGMPHRGRLNVLVNTLNKPYSVVFREFEDTFYPLSVQGSGDVKYHKGFTSDVETRRKKKVELHLSANASHLESVDPIVLGQTRALQDQKEDGKKKTCALLMHGDAAIAGQGIVYEILQFMNLAGYGTGGTIHLILNNQIGFTTLPEEECSTRYCTDIAKTFNCPVFHVNAEDPESCLFAAKLAIEIRQAFQIDVFINLNGYRKYGHNEGDEPSFTQPLQYKLIRQKKSIRELYRGQLIAAGHLEEQMAAKLEEEFKAELGDALSSAKESKEAPPELTAALGKKYQTPPEGELFEPVKTGVDLKRLRDVFEKSSIPPAGFHLHPKLQKWLQERKEMMGSAPSASVIDWGVGEQLAYATLLADQVNLRLTGQDSRRGTFSHRHMAWVDQENASLYFPLDHIQSNQGHFSLYNSSLSEYGVLGFEFGYSWEAPKDLVLWEAQFGDFVNGAEIILDQYLCSAEQKWFRTSSLVLLLPHGMEGQGPEHSSARLERFLQLCSNDNLQIVNATTPAQFFHAIRRQAIRAVKKPLVVFTPKSLLRSPDCTSSLNHFVSGRFEEILGDSQTSERLLLCSGRVYYDLIKEREKRGASVAIARIEQLYPLHKEKLKQQLAAARSVVWVQEEPQNGGAWEYICHPLEELLPKGAALRYAGRERSASPATGSHRQHELELRALLDEAFQ